MADPMTHPLTNALAMRTAAVSARWEDHVADNSPKYLTDWQRGLVAGQQAMRAAILALPLKADRTALLAEAVNLAEVQALIEATKETSAILQAAVVAGKVRGGDSYRIGGVYLQTVSDALDAADLSLQPFLALETP